MTSSKISDLAANFSISTSAAGNLDSAKKTDQNQSVFASLMSQSSKQSFSSATNDISQVKASQSAETVKQDTGRNSDTSRIRQATQDTTTIRDKVADSEDTVEDEIKDVIKKELSVTDEQLEDAMAKLGLTAMDLMNPANLTQVVAELTGSGDVSELLMSDSFLSMMQQIGDIAQNFADDLGISLQELQVTVEQMANTEGMQSMIPEDASAQQPQDPGMISDEAANTSAVQTGDKSAQNTAANNQNVILIKNQNAAADEAEDQSSLLDAEENAAQTKGLSGGLDAAEESETGGTSENGSQNNSLFSKNSQRSSDVNYAEVILHNVNQNANTADNIALQTQTATAYTTAVDVEDILNQIAEFTKIHVSQEKTSVEMQLNPENLGKLYLQISSTKEGSVTAQFTAQSEAVRAALESQMADLRQTLNQQGIKVDAIEVTIASHEFERNLEQNASGGQQQASEEQQQKSGRRNLQVGTLDELSGLMTEEELLAARIMKENGNSMDVTA